jgi:Putative Actinobacterial Holin-X, holin superfamily III
MKSEIVAFAQRQATMAVRRTAVPAAFALAGAVLVLFAAAGLFAALFFWLEPSYGPLAASLIVSAIAFVLGLLALLPLVLKRRQRPQAPANTLPQFVALLTQSTPGLAPRLLIVTAVLLVLILGLTARSGRSVS